MAKRKPASTPRADRGNATSTTGSDKRRGRSASKLLAPNEPIRTAAASGGDNVPDDDRANDSGMPQANRLAIGRAVSTILRAFVSEKDPNIKPILLLSAKAAHLAYQQQVNSILLDDSMNDAEFYELCLQGNSEAKSTAGNKDYRAECDRSTSEASELRASIADTSLRVVTALACLDGHSLGRDQQFLVDEYLTSQASAYSQCQTEEERESFANGAVIGLQCLVGTQPNSNAIRAVRIALPVMLRGRGRIRKCDEKTFVARKDALRNVLAAFGQPTQSAEALKTNVMRAKKDRRKDPF